MDYNHIKEFFKKFDNLINEKENLLKLISLIIKEKISFDIDIKDIKIKSGVVFINTTPLVKNEIFINKSFILDKINNEYKNKIIDIK